jgi:AcrR family transcriptional regulator
MSRSSNANEAVGLRERIIEVAGKVLVQEGYQNLSMRRVAQEAGCSQMAMYRHFANKEALTQHLCTQLYRRFAARISREIEAISDPGERFRRIIASIIRFAIDYPDHYSLIFLVRHADPTVVAERERLGQEFLAEVYFPTAEALLPRDTPKTVIDTRLRQMLCCLHGTAALLIAHPRAYGLTQQKAIAEAEAMLGLLFGRS